jgi:hypothetical protein
VKRKKTKKKKMTLGWVSNGERHHAGRQGELVSRAISDKEEQEKRRGETKVEEAKRKQKRGNESRRGETKADQMNQKVTM